MQSKSEFSPNFRIPIGTQVVLKRDHRASREGVSIVRRAGSVAEVTEQPLTNESAYVLCFADGATCRAHRKDLAIRRSMAPEERLEEREVGAYAKHLILRVATGSRVYGLATEHSDVDEKGVFVPPAEWHWSIHPLPEQVEFKRTHDLEIFFDQRSIDADDHCWWEVEKFLKLALRANPTALEVLYTPEEMILDATELGLELLEMRGKFLSRHIYHTYSGYALSQFRRMKRELEKGKPHRPKHAMHLLRLLYSGITALREGTIPVDMSAHREELLRVKTEELPFQEIYERALELDERFQEAFAETALPEVPDVEAIDRFLIRARRSAL